MKVFLGYAAGTGKTYAMLEAAHEAEKSGIDVVAGYIEPHNRPDTEALREGLEEIPPLMVDYKGIQLREFDLDAALKRRPQLLLVDELAHTNVRGCRNEKRYQDVMELLPSGDQCIFHGQYPASGESERSGGEYYRDPGPGTDPGLCF